MLAVNYVSLAVLASEGGAIGYFPKDWQQAQASSLHLDPNVRTPVLDHRQILKLRKFSIFSVSAVNNSLFDL